MHTLITPDDKAAQRTPWIGNPVPDDLRDGAACASRVDSRRLGLGGAVAHSGGVGARFALLRWDIARATPNGFPGLRGPAHLLQRPAK